MIKLLATELGVPVDLPSASGSTALQSLLAWGIRPEWWMDDSAADHASPSVSSAIQAGQASLTSTLQTLLQLGAQWDKKCCSHLLLRRLLNKPATWAEAVLEPTWMEPGPHMAVTAFAAIKDSLKPGSNRDLAHVLAVCKPYLFVGQQALGPPYDDQAWKLTGQAAVHGDARKLQMLLDAGFPTVCHAKFPIDERIGRSSAFLLAVSQGKLECAQALLRHRSTESAHVDERGMNAAHWFASTMCKKVQMPAQEISRFMRTLIDAGVDILARDCEGRTPLLDAVFNEKAGLVLVLPVLAALRAKGAIDHINLASKSGMTPLMTAVMSGQAAAVDVLLKAVASGLLDSTGRLNTGLLLQRGPNKEQIAGILLRHADKSLSREQWCHLEVAESGRLSPVAWIIKVVAPDASDSDPERALSYMADLLHQLAQRGADLGAAGRYGLPPFLIACLDDPSGTAAAQLLQLIYPLRPFLVNAVPGCAFDGGPLHLAASLGNVAAVRAVLRALKETQPSVPLDARLLCSWPYAPAPFLCPDRMLAGVLRELLEAGMDLSGLFNMHSLDLLSVSAMWGNYDAVKVLLDAGWGAHPQQQLGSYQQLGQEAATPPATSALAASGLPQLVTEGSSSSMDGGRPQRLPYIALEVLDIWLTAWTSTQFQKQQTELSARQTAPSIEDNQEAALDPHASAFASNGNCSPPLQELRDQLLPVLLESVANSADAASHREAGPALPNIESATARSQFGIQRSTASEIALAPCVNDKHEMAGPAAHLHCMHALLKAGMTIGQPQHANAGLCLARHFKHGEPGFKKLTRIMAKLKRCSALDCGQWGYLRQCAKCKAALYCSKACQSAHHTVHKHACSKAPQCKIGKSA